MPPETIAGHLYDYPHYYDVVFGADWKEELQFLRHAFVRYAQGKVRSIFEPACGTGRLLHRLARAGYQVSGLDLSEKSVAYCNARLKRLGTKDCAFVANMADFALPKPVDAAFNMINSVRHLMSEAEAVAHFACMAQAVRPGGLYIVGLHLSPTTGTPIDEESWRAKRGSLAVNTHLWTIQRDLSERLERCGLTLDIRTPTKKLRIRDDLLFRTYNWKQLRQVIDTAGGWELVALHDFSYAPELSPEPNASTEDIVLVLRRSN